MAEVSIPAWTPLITREWFPWSQIPPKVSVSEQVWEAHQESWLSVADILAQCWISILEHKLLITNRDNAYHPIHADPEVLDVIEQTSEEIKLVA